MTIWYSKLYNPESVKDLAAIYFRHIVDAQLPDGRFHNFKNKNGKFLDEVGSDDSFGRTIWALGVASKSTLIDQATVRHLYQKATPYARSLRYPRSVAFALLGAKTYGDNKLTMVLEEKLTSLYQKNASPEWKWFEECLTYSNAILPYSLLGHEKSMNTFAIEALNFLNTVSRIDGVPAPIGNNGWYCKNKKRAYYDQQSIDAADMVLANLAAYRVTGDKRYLREAQDWVGWFYGFNLKMIVMVTKDGGCYDGINETSINRNQGAESVLAYLLAYLARAAQDRLKKTRFSIT